MILAGCVFGSISQFTEADIKQSQNEIYNSNFEILPDSETGELAGWTLMENSIDHISLVMDEFQSGEFSLKIANPAKKISLISDSFPIDPESVYYTRCYIKNNYKSNHPVELHFVAFNTAGKKMNSYKTHIYPDAVWTKAVLTAGFFKQEVRFARVIITFPARDDKVYWLDDVESYNIYKIQK